MNMHLFIRGQFVAQVISYVQQCPTVLELIFHNSCNTMLVFSFSGVCSHLVLFFVVVRFSWSPDLCPNSERVSSDDRNVLISFSNCILWRKTWCQHVTCWGLELSTPEWLGRNIPGKCQPILC